MAFLYPPGQHPGRKEYTPDRFTPRPEHIYQALATAVYAFTNGQMGTLRPTPGVKIDMDDFKKWQAKALDAWKTETNSRGRGKTRAIVKEDFPQSLWFWLYQRIKAAPASTATSIYG